MSSLSANSVRSRIEFVRHWNVPNNTTLIRIVGAMITVIDVTIRIVDAMIRMVNAMNRIAEATIKFVTKCYYEVLTIRFVAYATDFVIQMNIFVALTKLL